MIRLQFSPDYLLDVRKLLDNDPGLRDQIDLQVKRFVSNPKDNRIRNHPLKGKLRGKFAFSITSDIRIVYQYKEKNVVQFLAIGDHKTVYS